MIVKHDTEHEGNDTHKNSTIFEKTIIKGNWKIYGCYTTRNVAAYMSPLYS
jgi:hypothetical protein